MLDYLMTVKLYYSNLLRKENKLKIYSKKLNFSKHLPTSRNSIKYP